MANTRPMRFSFSSGELTPELFGRMDLDKFAAGLEICRNFIVLPHGPVANRPGTEYINEVKDSSSVTRLIPFSFNAQQTFALEFGHHYIRFHTQGATLLETVKNITAVTQANPGVFTSAAHGYSNGQWLYALGLGGMNALNYRYYLVDNATANTYTLKHLDGTVVDTTALPAYTAGGTTSRVYEVATTYDAADLFDLHYIQSADVLTITHVNYPPAELRRLGATSWTLTNISFVPGIAAPVQGTLTTAGPGGGTPSVHSYVVTAIANGTLEESTAAPEGLNPGTAVTAATNANPGVITSAAHGLAVGEKVYISGVGGMTQLNSLYFLVNTVPTANTLTLKTLAGAVVDTTAYGVYTAGGRVYLVGVRMDLSVAGNSTVVSWAAVPGAIRYNVYKLRSGLYGYIGQTAGITFADDNIEADTQSPPPEYQNPFSGTGNYPGAVSYFEQRRAFGGTANAPQTLWMTRPGTESNLAYSIPTRDDDAISFTVKAREINKVQHIIPLGDLILLTNGGEWKVSSGDSLALTPSTLRVRPQGYTGASMVQPEVTGYSVLYVQAESSHIRELTYDGDRGLRSLDVSLLGTHLFDYHQITDIAFSKGTVPILWTVRDDGVLLGLTYLPDQQVIAWHRHDTDGLFLAVCAITESNASALYTIVQREIDGRTVRYIERVHTRQFATLADAYFVDCGLTYDGAPTTSITRLWHLEGETVSILVDGAVHPRRVVTNGAITLEIAASKVHVGLPIEADIKTPPLALMSRSGLSGPGQYKNISEAWLRVHRSSGVFVGPSFDSLTEAKQRTTEPYGSPPSLKTGELEVMTLPEWGPDGALCIRQSDPLPLTLLSISMLVAVSP